MVHTVLQNIRRHCLHVKRRMSNHAELCETALFATVSHRSVLFVTDMVHTVLQHTRRQCLSVKQWMSNHADLCETALLGTVSHRSVLFVTDYGTHCFTPYNCSIYIITAQANRLEPGETQSYAIAITIARDKNHLDTTIIP